MKRTVLLLSALTFSMAGFSQNLVGHWNFNNGAATDISGNSHNGTLYGGVSAATGRDGIANTALNFNGSTGYVKVPGDVPFNLTSWTLSAIVKPAGFYSGNCEVNSMISHGTEYSGEYYNLRFFDNAYDHACGVFSPNNEIFATAAAGYNPVSWNLTNFVNTGVWYCVTGTYANDTLKVYVDGVLQTAGYYHNQYYYSGTPADLFFGTYDPANSSYPYWFNGLIDDIQIWDGGLSADSVGSLCAQHEYPTDDTATHPTGVNIMQEANGIALAPNPAVGFTKVVLPLSWSDAQVSIINAMGQTLMTQSVSNANSAINIQELPAGMYIVRIEHDGIVVNRRLVVR